jgi:hypothetical protein
VTRNAPPSPPEPVQGTDWRIKAEVRSWSPEESAACAAIALRRAGIEVTVVEQAPVLADLPNG